MMFFLFFDYVGSEYDEALMDREKDGDWWVRFFTPWGVLLPMKIAKVFDRNNNKVIEFGK